jgi:glyceraldehyde 3-phosphate dehydrogenase
MTIRIAINGYGRIGRNIVRAHYEGGKRHDIQFVALNDLGDAKTNAHLTRYDTAHGKFPGTVGVEGDNLVVNGDKIRVCAQRNPAELPWKDLKVDVVLECTGLFNSKAKTVGHIEAGAKKVIISAPGDKDVDATVVYGVNHQVLKASHTVISNASCTTNCLAPMAKALHDRIGLVSGLMTTIHAYTNDQVLTDTYHKDLRRARSATMSMIPTKTGAAAAVGLVLPELNGKLDGFAIRVLPNPSSRGSWSTRRSRSSRSTTTTIRPRRSSIPPSPRSPAARSSKSAAGMTTSGGSAIECSTSPSR